MYKLSASELKRRFQHSHNSATEIANFFLTRIENLDHQTGAFLTVFRDRCMRKAEELDQKKRMGQRLGKLAGIPIGIKDNIHIKGELTTCASKFLANYRALFDATVVRLLEQEDALIVGKLNMDEFAMGSSNENSAFQLTRNPWDLDCSPGGSSGGSAAAVAARYCPLSLGSDTGGSIRQPAAFNSVVGFKPTYGRVSRFGLVAFASSLDQIGPMGTNVEDVAMAMEVMGRHCPYDATSSLSQPEPYLDHLTSSIQGKKVGVPWGLLDNLDPEIYANFENALKCFEELGVEIVDVDLSTTQHAISVYYILATAEASTNLAKFDGIQYGIRSAQAKTLDEIYEFSKRDGFGQEVKQRILLGTYVLSSGFQNAFYKKAQKVRRLILNEYNRAFDFCSVIAMPVTPTATFPLGSIRDPLTMYLQDLYTISTNLAGIPAISIPAGFTKSLKPLGLQIMGPQMEDGRVLRFAHHLEKSLQIHPVIAPLFDKER